MTDEEPEGEHGMLRKQNSTFKTAFISEAGSGLENNDYFAFVELESMPVMSLQTDSMIFPAPKAPDWLSRLSSWLFRKPLPFINGRFSHICMQPTKLFLRLTAGSA